MRQGSEPSGVAAFIGHTPDGILESQIRPDSADRCSAGRDNQRVGRLRNCPEIISVIPRRMDFQSVRKKTDWKSVLRFAKPPIISRQRLSCNDRTGCNGR